MLDNKEIEKIKNNVRRFLEDNSVIFQISISFLS